MPSLRDEEIDLTVYLRVLWRRKYLVTAVVAIAVLTAGLVSQFVSPVYEAEVVIRLSEHSASVYTSQPSAIRVMTTTAFLHAVEQEAAVGLSPSRLRRLVRVDPVRDTGMIRVRVRHNDPASAKRLAESMTALFIARASERVQERRKLTDVRLKTVNDQLREIQSILTLSRRVLSRLQGRNVVGRDSEFIRSFSLNTVSISEALYASLQDAQRQLTVELLAIEFPAIIEAPILPQEPISPRVALNLVMGAFVGMLAGFGVAFAAERLQTPGPQVVSSPLEPEP